MILATALLGGQFVTIVSTCAAACRERKKECKRGEVGNHRAEADRF